MRAQREERARRVRRAWGTIRFSVFDEVRRRIREFTFLGGGEGHVQDSSCHSSTRVKGNVPAFLGSRAFMQNSLNIALNASSSVSILVMAINSLH